MDFAWEYLPEASCYCVKGISYCSAPSNPGLQSMNIYAPVCYMNPDGSISRTGVCTPRPGVSYTARTVPVVFYNDIGGYAECAPAELTERNRRYLEDGFVLVSMGARGRQSRGTDGRPTGKAPAALVDLKAGIRWLRAHRADLPGDYDKIISVGTSAGGAMSSLLGVSGNAEYFLPYLRQIGAEMDERDDIFAAQCYCPIIDLEHADMAYEWMFGAKMVSTRGAKVPPRVMNPFRQALSDRLAKAYPGYINSLPLDARLGEDGRSGSFYDGLMERLSDSLTKFLRRSTDSPEQRSRLAEELSAGTQLISWDGENARITDLDQYVLTYIGRMKPCPAFDDLDCASFENEEFGTEAADKQHFSQTPAELVRCLADDNDIPEQYRAMEDISPDIQARTRQLNPLYYLTGGCRGDIARHFRIRLGSHDSDTSFGVSYSLYLALRAAGIDADYALVWGLGHCDADYPEEFSAWADALS